MLQNTLETAALILKSSGFLENFQVQYQTSWPKFSAPIIFGEIFGAKLRNSLRKMLSVCLSEFWGESFLSDDAENRKKIEMLQKLVDSKEVNSKKINVIIRQFYISLKVPPDNNKCTRKSLVELAMLPNKLNSIYFLKVHQFCKHFW